MLLNYAILLILGVIWGSSFLFIKVALEGFGPFTLGVVRLAIGGVMVFSLAMALRQPLPARRSEWLWILVIGTVSSAIAFAFMNVGMQQIESSVGGIIITIVPLFTLALAHWFTDDRLTLRKLVGVLVGLGGILVMFGPALWEGMESSTLGQLFIVVTAFCYAAGSVMARRSLANVAPLVAAGLSLLWAAALLTPVTLAVENPFEIDPSLYAWLGALGAAIFSTGIAISLLFILIRRAGPNFAAANNYLAPVVSLTWGAIFLLEPITTIKIIALLLLLAGIAIATWRSNVGRAPAGAPLKPQKES